MQTSFVARYFHPRKNSFLCIFAWRPLWAIFDYSCIVIFIVIVESFSRIPIQLDSDSIECIDEATCINGDKLSIRRNWVAWNPLVHVQLSFFLVVFPHFNLLPNWGGETTTNEMIYLTSTTSHRHEVCPSSLPRQLSFRQCTGVTAIMLLPFVPFCGFRPYIIHSLCEPCYISPVVVVRAPNAHVVTQYFSSCRVGATVSHHQWTEKRVTIRASERGAKTPRAPRPLEVDWLVSSFNFVTLLSASYHRKYR